jgi:hypothetical protein
MLGPRGVLFFIAQVLPRAPQYQNNSTVDDVITAGDAALRGSLRRSFKWISCSFSFYAAPSWEE